MSNSYWNAPSLNQTGGAMHSKRRIEITVEKTLLIIRRTATPAIWCAECPAPAQMLAPDEAAALLGINIRAIYLQVESGQSHFVETPEGKLLVCPNSLTTLTT
jgi:hypothetical protein